MDQVTVNENAPRGRYVGSQVARMDERGRPVDWQLANDHADAVALAERLTDGAPGQEFVIYDSYVEPIFAEISA